MKYLFYQYLLQVHKNTEVSLVAPQTKNSNKQTLKMRALQTYDEMIKIILVGDSNVGKTSFLNRFCHNNYKRNIPCTVGLQYGQKIIKVGENKVLVQLWDTAGQDRFRNLTPSFYRSAMAIILMYSVDNRQSFNSVAIWMKQINTFAIQDVPVMLVCNKADLNKKQVSDKQSQALAQAYKLCLIMTSCQQNINIQQTVVETFKKLRRGKTSLAAMKNSKLMLKYEKKNEQCSYC